jgi:MOSC domain-containing protein YiiM
VVHGYEDRFLFARFLREESLFVCFVAPAFSPASFWQTQHPKRLGHWPIRGADGKDHRPMKLVSVNVGLPREVTWHGRLVTTAIFKQPVAGRVALRKLNLDGDRQADLTVHGGEHKAVYCYPLEHYAYWKKELPGQDLPLAMFGENFTTEGLLEDSVHLGDQFSVGSAQVVATQPRLPCYKLGIRFQSDDMVKRFLASARTGFYLAVTREGEVGAGDTIKLLARDPNAVPVSEITRLYVVKRFGDGDATSVRRALQVTAFPESWKAYFHERLEKMNA